MPPLTRTLRIPTFNVCSVSSRPATNTWTCTWYSAGLAGDHSATGALTATGKDTVELAPERRALKRCVIDQLAPDGAVTPTTIRGVIEVPASLTTRPWMRKSPQR